MNIDERLEVLKQRGYEETSSYITVNSGCDCRFIEPFDDNGKFVYCSYHFSMPELHERFENLVRSLFIEKGYSHQLYEDRIFLDELAKRKMHSGIA